jgi:hypothetical protein
MLPGRDTGAGDPPSGCWEVTLCGALGVEKHGSKYDPAGLEDWHVPALLGGDTGQDPTEKALALATVSSCS